MQRMTTRSGRRSTWPRAVVGIALAAAMTACAGTEEDWPGYAEAPQPRVERVTLRHVVDFPVGSSRMSRAQWRELAAFLGRADPKSAERVMLATGAATGGRGGYGLARQREQQVATAVRRAGAAPRAVSAGGTVAANAVAVFVSRDLVVLPECPDWTASPSLNYGNRTPSNWGCATAVNLGIMIANPRDLIRGEDLAPADAERLSRAIERYRQDKTKPLIDSPTSEAAPGAGSGGFGGGG